MNNKPRAGRNRTITLESNEAEIFSKELMKISAPITIEELCCSTINQDFFEAVQFLPERFADLLIIDPPYNLYRKFNSVTFREKSEKEYYEYFESIIAPLSKIVKKNASIYVCSDWRSSTVVSHLLGKYFIIRNRITWEREKGRGSKTNWKNNSEDIWFCTVSGEYQFNPDAVKQKRMVIAPYRDKEGKPKDWDETEDGNYRLTYPSNLWTDISVPFWSMPENTDHPTQKPEKLIAKLILASSSPGDFVFDPFLGSGTTSVVAKKLGRKFAGIETDPVYAALTVKRLRMAEKEISIQGYDGSSFWERNTFTKQKKFR